MKVQSKILTPEVEAGALRIAFASTDGETVDLHFGKGMEFVLFDVNAKGYKKSGKITFSAEGEDEPEHSTRNQVKTEALVGCHIVYSAAIGGPVAAKLTQRNIQPLIVKEEARIPALLEQFQNLLNGPLPPWIGKLIRKNDPNRFAAYDQEEDEE